MLATTSISTGSMRHFVCIEANSPTRTDGVQVDSWATVTQAWASFEPLTMKETAAAGQISNQVTQAVEMRYTSTPITAGMRINYQFQLWAIESVTDVGLMHIKLRLLVTNTGRA